jgi:hypothetical protein
VLKIICSVSDESEKNEVALFQKPCVFQSFPQKTATVDTTNFQRLINDLDRIHWQPDIVGNPQETSIGCDTSNFSNDHKEAGA